MIQSPQLQYVQTQQPVQAGYQQQNAAVANAVQSPAQQVSSPIYNYPTASSYLPAQNGKSQFNGVNIEILNPQGQGVPTGQNPIPAQYYYPLTQPIQQSAIPAQYFNPLQQTPQPVFQQPAQQQPVNQPVQPPVVPAPEVQQQIPPAPVIEQAAPQTPSINPETFAGRLKSNDTDVQKAAIEEIATKVKKVEPDDTPEVKNEKAQGPALLDTQIFEALVDIVNKDTSSLAGPTPEILELRQKAPEQLTPEEKEKTALTPLEKAEINKQYALYTISYMQERLNLELQQKNVPTLELKDLPCIDTVVDAAKSNQNPMIRIAALASLSNIAKTKPEYKQDMKTIFELAKSDEDQRVRETAITAAENLEK